MQKIDPAIFRRSLGHYASGITVVTGMVDNIPVGFTCQSFHSVSTQPPLISLCVMLSSTSWPRIRDTGRFCVNVLSRNQRHISDGFARSGADKWDGVEWSLTDAGNPVIEGVLIWLECELSAEHLAGDHIIVLGAVRAISSTVATEDRGPLLFFKGQYHHLGD